MRGRFNLRCMETGARDPRGRLIDTRGPYLRRMFNALAIAKPNRTRAHAAHSSHPSQGFSTGRKRVRAPSPQRKRTLSLLLSVEPAQRQHQETRGHHPASKPPIGAKTMSSPSSAPQPEPQPSKPQASNPAPAPAESQASTPTATTPALTPVLPPAMPSPR